MQIIPYETKYQKDFERLNRAWITKYFQIEAADEEIFQNTERLIQSGSMIYLALLDGEVRATCMVTPLQDDVWEIGKLAADERYQGHGAGNAVFKACVQYAIAHQAKKIMLISNHILLPAIHIYEKNGFVKVPCEQHEYSRGDVQYAYIATENQ